jgi:hypothetical protein
MKRNFVQSFVDALCDIETTPQTKRALIQARAAIDLALCKFPLLAWTELPADLVLQTFLTQRSGARLCRRFFQIYIERKVRRLRIPGTLAVALDMTSLPTYPDSVNVDIVVPVFKTGWFPACLIMFLVTRRLLDRLVDVTMFYTCSDFGKTTFVEVRGMNHSIRATGNVLFFSHAQAWYGVRQFVWKVTTIRQNRFYALVHRRFPNLQSLRIEITEDPTRLRAFKHLAYHLAEICNKQSTLTNIELPTALYDRLYHYMYTYVRAKCIVY